MLFIFNFNFIVIMWKSVLLHPVLQVLMYTLLKSNFWEESGTSAFRAARGYWNSLLWKLHQVCCMNVIFISLWFSFWNIHVFSLPCTGISISFSFICFDLITCTFREIINHHLCQDLIYCHFKTFFKLPTFCIMTTINLSS